MHHQMIICFLLIFLGAAAADPNHISINCGGAASAAGLGGRRWLRDAAAEGSSATSTMKGELIATVDSAPYKTARLSRSRFSYTFQLSPGQKSIRLHFNPSSYNGFETFNDLFKVEAGPFSLLANFSASVTARALDTSVVVREFCVNIKENETTLNLAFSPESGNTNNYAFINGIEIVSYCHGGAHMIGQKPMIHVDNSTELERVAYRHVKWGPVSSEDDIGGMFGMWAESSLKRKAETANSKSWRVSVDVGFRYLVRIHLCEVGLEMDFVLLVNNIITLTSADMRQRRGNRNILWYNDYMVMVEASEEEEKRDISILLHSQHEFLDRHGPLEGFEVFKLRNPLLQRGDSHQTWLHSFDALLNNLHVYMKPLDYITRAYIVVLTTFIIATVVKLEHTMPLDYITKELVNKQSANAKQPCRLFSQSTTKNFQNRRDKFGSKVYKGHTDNGPEVVEIKRLSPRSKLWEQRFWIEVDMLTVLILVSLIAYCRLVYEYMDLGTLADHLYKLARKNNDCYPLSWKEHLTCLGASRVLDYLHMGHRISHRDLILSDFGLAEIGSGSVSRSQHIKTFKGSSACLDSIPFRTTDTYSFGVLLLEILCGRPTQPWNEQDKGSLTTWDILKNDHIVARNRRGKILPGRLKIFMKIAEGSPHDNPKIWPETAQVVTKLVPTFLQQEKAKSVAMNERTRVSCTDKSEEENMNLFEYVVHSGESTFFSRHLNVPRHYVSNSLLGARCFIKSFGYEPSCVETESRYCFPGKKLIPESTLSYPEWHCELSLLRRSLSRAKRMIHSLEKRLLRINYGLLNFDQDQLYWGSNFQSLPRDVKLKTLFGADRAPASAIELFIGKFISWDLKASNTLFGGSYHAKLPDFGLVKMRPTASEPHVTAPVMGIYGNIDSEDTGHANWKRGRVIYMSLVWCY